MRIVIYTQIVRRASGVTTFEKNFLNSFASNHELIYMFKAAEGETLQDLPPSIQCIRDTGQEVTCDLCVYSSLIHGHPHPNVKAKRYIQMYHADPDKWQLPLPDTHIDIHIAVGDSVACSLKSNFGISPIVIPNIVLYRDNKRVLKLITASRVARGKGFERMIKLARLIKKYNQLFTWQIYGTGSPEYVESIKAQLEYIPEVVFMGSRPNMMPYMVDMDYLVQLSDHEGFCYSIHEALMVNTPCIITNFEEGRKVITHGKNGLIYDMDLTNFDIDELYNFRPKAIDYTSNGALQKWEDIFKL